MLIMAHKIYLIHEINRKNIVGGSSARSGSSSGRERGGHLEGSTPWECPEFW